MGITHSFHASGAYKNSKTIAYAIYRTPIFGTFGP